MSSNTLELAERPAPDIPTNTITSGLLFATLDILVLIEYELVN